jgi:putative protein-disulfide isomerase
MSGFTELEVVFIEDPACSWCWAFQPVETAFLFEFGENVPWRSVMGGLRDQPVPDVTLVMRHWETAQSVSGMPFEPEIWKKHVLRSTYTACRAVKAASIRSPEGARRLLRRLREAFYVEQAPIDDLELIFTLAGELELGKDDLLEQIASGRAESLFSLDRDEASRHGFGFPTIVIRKATMEPPVVLEGAVSFRELTEALSESGVPASARRRFRDQPADWNRLFEIQPRLALAELLVVTSMGEATIRKRLAEFGIRQEGAFFCRGESNSGPGDSSRAPNPVAV